MKSEYVMLALALMMLVVPMVSAAEQRSTLSGLNMWDALVEYTFGNFWVTVVMLCILYGVILIFGGLSPTTSIVFLGVFFMAMVLGYGYELFSVLIFAAAGIFMIFQAVRAIGEMY